MHSFRTTIRQDDHYRRSVWIVVLNECIRGARLGQRGAEIGSLFGPSVPVEEALGEAGAEPGDEILIGDPDDAVVFDWDPTVQAFGGRGPRGTDRRLTP